MSSNAPNSSSETPSGPSGNGASGHERSSASPWGNDVSLLDILLVVGTVIDFALLGMAYALSAPGGFTSKAQAVQEAQTDGDVSPHAGIFPGSLSGLGINLGDFSSGLSVLALTAPRF